MTAKTRENIPDQLRHHLIPFTVDTYVHLVAGAHKKALHKFDDRNSKGKTEEKAPAKDRKCPILLAHLAILDPNLLIRKRLNT